jgi:ABC-type polysaccharide/polyol phosphate export permease
MSVEIGTEELRPSGGATRRALSLFPAYGPVAHDDARSAGQIRGLVWTLVRTDFKTRYQPTLGGFLWALLKPVAMFLVLSAVFSFIFGSDPSYRFNLITGLFLWDFFSEATKTGIVALHTNGYLLNKARFPAWILVITSISNALITLGVFSVVVLGSLAAAGRAPGPVALALFGWYLVQYMFIVFGVSLAGSVLFPRYRDLNQVWDLVTQAGFFIAPIVYPLSIMPERFHVLLYGWPPTPIIQFSRAVLVDGTVPTVKAHLLLAGESAAILLIGIATYRAFRPRVAEYL